MFAVTTAGAASDGAGTETQQAKEEVLAVEAVRLQALLDGDVETLDRITGADYVHVASTGRVRDKAQFLAGLANREYRFKRFVIEQNNVDMLGSGDAAVVTGRYRNVIETRDGVQPVKQARHIRVYARRDGRWINVSHQATEISSESN